MKALVLIGVLGAACTDGSTLKLERGVEAKLPDGARIVFTSHGHKHGEDAGPLLISGKFFKPGADSAEEFDVAVEPTGPQRFRVGGGYTFALKKYQYDVSMDVEFLGVARQ